MKRREVIKLIGGAAAAWPLGARAQQATKIPQIGVLSLGRGDKSDASLATLNAFMPALYELGYTEAPVPVVMDEAIELAKMYSTEDSAKFVNGVLAAAKARHEQNQGAADGDHS